MTVQTVKDNSSKLNLALELKVRGCEVLRLPVALREVSDGRAPIEKPSLSR